MYYYILFSLASISINTPKKKTSMYVWGGFLSVSVCVIYRLAVSAVTLNGSFIPKKISRGRFRVLYHSGNLFFKGLSSANFDMKKFEC